MIAASVACWIAGCQRNDAWRDDPPAVEPSTVEPSRVEPSRVEPSKVEASRIGSTTQSPAVTEPTLDDAIAALGRGDTDRAESLVRSLLIQSPTDRWLHLLSAEVRVQRGDWAGGVESLRGLLDQHPDFPEARRSLAMLLNQRGLRFLGNQELRRLAGQTALTSQELIALAFPSRTFVTFREKPDPSDETQRRRDGVLNMVAAMRARGEFREALAGLRRSDLYRDRHPSAVALDGWLLALNQDQAALRRWAAESDVQCQRHPAFWIAMGELAMRESDPAASVCFTEAIRREPGILDSWDGFVAALQRDGPAAAVTHAQTQRRVVAEIQFLVQEVVQQPASAIDMTMVARLAKLLNDSGRLIESVAWQEFAIASSNPASPRLAELASFKLRLRNRFPTGLDASKLLGLPPGLGGGGWPDQKVSDSFLRRLRQPAIGMDPLPASARRSDPRRPEPRLPTLVDVAPSVGLRFRHHNGPRDVTKHFKLFEALGSGVACLDFDRDGELDLIFGQSGGTPPKKQSRWTNALFRGVDGRWVDVTLSAGVTDRNDTMGLTVGDWNQDGFDDLFVGNLGRNRLFINHGDGTFGEVDGDAVWNEPMLTSSIAIADVTGDHLPDLIECNYVNDDRVFDAIALDRNGQPLTLPGPLHFQAAANRVFVSRGDGKMRGRELAVDGQPLLGTALGAVVTDIDGQPGNEIFVANDQRANQLWTIDGDADHWVARETAVASGLAYGVGGKPMACMGVAVADFDGRGGLDFHITNFTDESVNLYLQRSPGLFVDSAVPMGLGALSHSMLGFGTQAIDYDNNASWDLIVGNGHIEDFRDRGRAFQMPTQLFANHGDRFEAMTVDGDDAYWKTGHLSRAVAKCDWNRDGRVDVIVTGLNEPARLLENRTQTPHSFLQIELVGVTSERDAIGASVTVTAGQSAWTQVMQTGDGYLAKNESVLMFGLGDERQVDTITVRWPDGESWEYSGTPINQRILIVQDQPDVWDRRE